MQRAPSHFVRSDPVSKQAGRRNPRGGTFTLLESTFGCAEQRRGSYCATRPLLACARPDPRGWTPQPPAGVCYAARVHVWVRFLLPWTTVVLDCETQTPRKPRGIAPRRGARRPDAGVRPNEVRRGRVAQRERSLMQQPLEAPCKTRTPSHATAAEDATINPVR